MLTSLFFLKLKYLLWPLTIPHLHGWNPFLLEFVRKNSYRNVKLYCKKCKEKVSWNNSNKKKHSKTYKRLNGNIILQFWTIKKCWTHKTAFLPSCKCIMQKTRFEIVFVSFFLNYSNAISAITNRFCIRLWFFHCAF